jgi:ABC-type antimicrobial peptide transport system permease subunit
LILKNLFRRKGRTLLAVLGISIGVATIVCLGALINDLQSGYDAVLAGSEADLVLKDADALDLALSSVDESLGIKLSSMPGVHAVSGMIQGLVQTESALYFFVFSFPEDSFALERFHVVQGDPLYSKNQTKFSGNPLILGSTAAEVYNATVGDTLRIGETAFRVVGIYETGEAFEDGGAVLRFVDAQELLGLQHKVSAYYLQIDDPSAVDLLKTRIAQLYPDLLISTAVDLAGESNLVGIMRIVMGVISGLVILIGGVAMANAQLMAVFERTHEIGILRAIGWTRIRILLMILAESILIGVLGGMVGMGLAWLMLHFNQETLSAFGATATIPPMLLLRALILVLFLGIIGGLYPAIRASKMAPMEAMRYEGGVTGDRIRRFPVGGMAIQNLWRRKPRTLLTLFMIGITIGAILTIDTVLGSADGVFGSMFGGAELAAREADVANLILSIVDEDAGDRIAAMPEVKNVSGIIFSPMMTEGLGLFIIQGYAPRQEAIRSFNVVEGERIRGPNQIMLGRQVAQSQNLGVGDSLNLSGRRYRIVGIYEHTVTMFELGGVVSLRDAQNSTAYPNKVSFFSISLHDPTQADRVVDKINAQVPEVHASLSGSFATESPNLETASMLSNMISILAVLVGGVGMMNTMLMAVLERTREIGILRSLGWGRRSVLSLILRESMVLGLLGGTAGIALSLCLVTVFRSIALQDDSIRIVWTMENVIRALIVASLLALVGGLYPAFRATRLQPIEALRYE